jgi:hypothetical protein
MEAYPGTYSYREELQGLYYAMHRILRRFPNCKKVTCHCDCESGIKKILLPLDAPGKLMDAEMDAVLAIKKLVGYAGPAREIEFKHIRGHPEKWKARKDFTPLELMNSDCDKYANQCIELGQIPDPFQPLDGSRCMLRIGKTWISTRVDHALQIGFVEAELREYVAKCLEIELSIVDEIDKEVIAAARAAHKWAEIARISKLMFGWLPAGHNCRHHGAESDQCPCCGDPDETFEHLLECQEVGLVALRQECLRDVAATAAKKNIPSQVYSVMLGIVKRIVDGREPTIPSESAPVLLRAWESQKRIGFSSFIRGWVSKEWARAMKAYESGDPQGQTAQMLTIIWDGLCEPVCTYRNNKLYHVENNTMTAMLRTLGDRLQWFQDNKEVVLAPRHHMLAEYRMEDVQQWD